jgi:hypothetical protein
VAENIQVGELISYVESPGKELGGLVVEIRRTDCRVLNLDTDRSYWIPQTHIRRGTSTIRKGSATSLLSSLVLHLQGVQLEVERTRAGAIQAQIGCASLDADKVDQIRDYFGSALRALRILPGGLGKVILVVEFLPSEGTDSSSEA